MKFSKTLESKFGKFEEKEPQFKKPAVSCSLKVFLQNESIRIDNLINKKRSLQQKLERVQTQNLNYRENLKNRIQEQQENHEKNRKAFIQKRVKRQKFKMDQVTRKRKEHFEKQKQWRRSIDQNFRNYRTTSIEFWTNKEELMKKRYSGQNSAVPLYEQAVYRKKVIEQKNEERGKEVKEKLLSRHLSVSERIQTALKTKQELLDQHNKKIERGLQRNRQIMQEKQTRRLNDICFHQDRSTALLKSQKAQWIKKLQGKRIDQKQLKQKHKQNLADKGKRTQSMRQIRTHYRQGSDGMAKSINLNEEQKKPGSVSKLRSTVDERRKDFLTQSMTNFGNVKINKSILKQKKEIKDERALMIEKQISDAVKTREEIKTESNLLVRQARILA